MKKRNLKRSTAIAQTTIYDLPFTIYGLYIHHYSLCWQREIRMVVRSVMNLHLQVGTFGSRSLWQFLTLKNCTGSGIVSHSTALAQSS